MPECALDPQNICLYRDTPWDERALGMPTREILSFICENTETGIRLITELDRINTEDGVGLCFTRLNSADRITRDVFGKGGYRVVEQSYSLSLDNLSPFTDGHFGRALSLRSFSPEDLPLLQHIAAESFHFGRFAEDPMIPLAHHRERQRRWIADMAADQSIVFRVLGPESAPRGFHTYRQQGPKAVMILSGMDDAFRPLAGIFWVSCLADMAFNGIENVETMISASNLPVVNLYARLGFRFDALWVGFHKHYKTLGIDETTSRKPL